MLKLVFNTLNDERPVFKIKNYGIYGLLDTGANIPVWSGKLSSFLDTFKKCNPTKTGMIVNMSGFGEKAVQMEVYKIDNFELTDGKQRFVFKTLYVAIEENRKRGFDLLLTYSMFKSVNIVIKPLKLNRQIAFVTETQNCFNTSYETAKNDKNALVHTESYIQDITAQDVLANMVYELVEESKNNN